ILETNQQQNPTHRTAKPTYNKEILETNQQRNPTHRIAKPTYNEGTKTDCVESIPTI
ncbi:38645_t:CDS:2, partial [Gigaspora margarita]